MHRGAQVPSAPSVSIIIPCYELGDLAREAVQSAIDQTIDGVEIIVVDDGSRTPVAHHLQPLLDRIVVLRQANGGLSQARNAGIALARGAVIVLLDGDDLLLPSHCAACLHLFASDPSCMVAAPDAWIFGEGQPEGLKLSDLYPRSRPVDLEGFLAGTSLVPGCCTFRREAFQSVDGPYDVEFRSAEDFRLNTQLLINKVKFCFLSEPTYRYRKRAGSLSFNNPIPLTTAVVRALEKLEAENALNVDAVRLLRQAHERYSTELNFHRFRKAMLEKSFSEAAGYACAIQAKHLVPKVRRWKFYAGWAAASVLSRVTSRTTDSTK